MTDIPVEKLSNSIAGAYFGALIGDVVGRDTNGGNAQMLKDFNFATNEKQDPSFRFDMMNAFITMLLDETIVKDKYATHLASEFRRIAEGPTSDKYEFPSMMKIIMTNVNYTTDPFGVVTQKWIETQKKYFSNITLPLVIPAAMLVNAESKATVGFCMFITKMIQCDPRSICCATMYTHALQRVIIGDVDNIIDDVINMFEDCKTSDADKEAFKRYCVIARKGSIKDLQLSSQSTNLFTSFACVIYALRVVVSANKQESKTIDVEKLLNFVARECGSASINCSIVGSIVGAYVGVKCLPLTDKINNYSKTSELITNYTKSILSSDNN